MPDFWISIDLGEYIYSAIDRAMFVSYVLNSVVRFNFNDVEVHVKPTYSRDLIFFEYMDLVASRNAK